MEDFLSGFSEFFDFLFVSFQRVSHLPQGFVQGLWEMHDNGLLDRSLKISQFFHHGEYFGY
jgi:hypothetical protein